MVQRSDKVAPLPVASSQGGEGVAAPQARLHGATGPAALVRLVHFRILGRLGQGGMGDVYLAYDESLKRRVALKVLPPELAREPEFLRRFHAEAAAVAALDHPNVVSIYFHGKDGDHHFFAMQYVEGESLEHRLARRVRLGIDETLSLLDDCLAGLGAAHAAGLVHRDVKPGNILLDTREDPARALLADFGLVKLANPGTMHTATGVVLGTAEYMAPEQGQSHAVDARADLYSLGVVAYQALSGRLPFHGSTTTDLLFKHAFEVPPPLAEIAPDLPSDLVALVGRLMAKKPENRPESCEEVRALLEALRRQRGHDTPVPAASLSPESVQSAPRLKVSPMRPSVGTEQPAATLREVNQVVAQVENRLHELAALAEEAQAVHRELAAHARQCRVDAGRAVGSARADGERLAAELEAEAAAQEQNLSQLRIERDRVAAEAVCLRNQRDLLKARLHIAGAQGQRSKQRGRRRMLVSGAAAVLLLLVAAVALLPRREPEKVPADDRGAGVRKQAATLSAVPLDAWRHEDISEATKAYIGGGNPHWAPPELVGVLGDARYRRHSSAMWPAYSADGKLLAVGGTNGTVMVYDTATGRPMRTFTGLRGDIYRAIFSSGAKILAITESTGDAVSVWDVDRGTLLHRLAAGGNVHGLAFQPGGRLLATSDTTGKVRIWDLDTLTARIADPGHDGAVTSLAFRPDGLVFASVGQRDGKVRIWDLTGKLLRELSPGQPGINGARLAFSPDGRLLAAGADGAQEEAVTVWDASTYEEVARLATPAGGLVAFGPGGKTLWTARHNHLQGTPHVAKCWDLTTWKELPTLALHSKGGWACYDLAPDGKSLACHASGDRVTQVYDTATGKPRGGDPGHLEMVVGVAFSPDGRLLASASVDRTIRLWDLSTGTVRHVLTGHTDAARFVAFSPDGKRLASSSVDQTVRLWDVADGRCLWTSPSQGAQVDRLAFSSSGDLLAWGCRNGKVWVAPADRPDEVKLLESGSVQPNSLEDGLARQKLLAPGCNLHCVAARRDGRLIAGSGNGGTIWLWDLAATPPRRQTIRLFAPGNWLGDVVFSPDGRHLAAGGCDGLVYLFRLTPNVEGPLPGLPEPETLPPTPPGVKPPADALDRWSPKDVPVEAKAWAGLGDPDKAPAGLIGILGETRWRAHSAPTRLAHSPDGQRLAVALDSEVFLFDTTGRQLHRLAGKTNSIHRLAFAPDGRTLAFGNAKGEVEIWNPETGKRARTLAGNAHNVLALAIDSESTTLAVGHGNGKLYLWDLKTEQRKELSDLKQASFTSAAFHPKDKILVTGGNDKAIRLWDVAGAKLLKTTGFPQVAHMEIAFSQDGNMLVIGSDAEVRLYPWETVKGDKGPLRFAQVPAGCLAITPNGGSVFTARAYCVNGVPVPIKRLDAAAKEQLVVAAAPRADGWGSMSVSMSLSPDGSRLALACPNERVVRLFEAGSGKALPTGPGHMAGVHTVAFRPDGKVLASSDHDGTVRLWDLTSGKELRVLEAHEGQARGVAFSPDGKLLASSGDDGCIKLWDPATGRHLGAFAGHADALDKIAFSPDGRWLASPSKDHTVRLWDVAAGRETHVLVGHAKRVRIAVFAPDGQKLATAGHDGTIRLWDVREGRELRSLPGPDEVAGLAFLPDNKTLAVGGSDKVVTLWDVTSGTVTAKLTGTEGNIASVSVRGDGRVLAASGEDGSVRLWDLSSTPPRRQSIRLMPPNHWVADVAFSPGGGHLAAANDDGTVTLLRVPEYPGKEP